VTSSGVSLVEGRQLSASQPIRSVSREWYTVGGFGRRRRRLAGRRCQRRDRLVWV